MSKSRIVGALVVVIAAALVYVGFVRPTGGPAPGMAPGVASGPSASSAAAVAALSPDQKQQAYDTQVKALQQRVVRVQSFVDNFPAELLDIAALAQSLPTPDAAFVYVRDHIALEPYPGVMKGAAGTLESRGGNAIDRALLLAAILKQRGVTARIVRGKLAPERAQALAGQIATSEDAIQLIARSTAGRKPATTDSAQQAFESVRTRAATRAQALRGEADQQAKAIRAALDKAGAPGPADSAARQIAILQDHFWVQATIDGRPVDLDPSFRDAQAGQAPTETVQTFDAGRVPGDLFQQVTISVTAEFLNNGRLSSREIVRKQSNAVDLIGKNIRMAIEPQPLKPDTNDYAATIFVGNERPVSGTFQLRPVKGAAQPSSGGVGSMFGGALSGGGAQPEKPKAEGAPSGEVLGRLSVAVVSRAPQVGIARYRRVILDRLSRPAIACNSRPVPRTTTRSASCWPRCGTARSRSAPSIHCACS